MHTLQQVGVPAGVVHTNRDVIEDPQFSTVATSSIWTTLASVGIRCNVRNSACRRPQPSIAGPPP